MSARILNAQGILSSDVPTGNLLWVDAVNGVDALATCGRMTIPFKTLKAAKDAAQGGVWPNAGDTIIVLPGYYTTSEQLAKAGVNWHFLNGVLVTTDMANLSIFEVSSAMTFRVTGAGWFAPGGSGWHVMYVTDPSADVYFQGYRLFGTKSAIKMTSNSTVVVDADWINGDESSAIEASAGTLAVRARQITSDQLHAVHCTGATMSIDAFQIKSSAAKGIYFTAGTARIRAFEILATAGPAVEYNNSYTAALSISEARLVSTYASANGRAVYIASTSNALKLKHCTLIANRSGSIADSIGAVSGMQNVNLYGECAANNPISNVQIAGASPLDLNANLT